MSEKIKPQLSIRNLVTNFNTYEGLVRAVDGIDLDVYSGETLGLVGESGCGKSVTALSVLQLLQCPPAEIPGQIVFNDQNLLDLDQEQVRAIRGKSISMIFQEPMTSLNPVITIGEQIAESIRLHEGLNKQEAWERTVNMLDLVQIPSPNIRAREYPHQLSGGMRQRAMIAMALSCNPELLIADEPTTALDVTIQAQIMNIMLRLKEELNMSMMLITHDLGIVAETASRVIVMYAGRIVEEAPVREIFKDPLHPYTKGLLGSVPVIGKKVEAGRRLQEIPGVVPSLLQMPQGCRFNPRCPQVMDVCKEKEPPMAAISQNRRVQCWLENDLVK